MVSKVSKGSCVFMDWWYVVVEHTDNGFLRCICDNANNMYSWNVEDADAIYTAKEVMQAVGWGTCDEKLEQHLKYRSIPIEVIAEVLAGCHDDRW